MADAPQTPVTNGEKIYIDMKRQRNVIPHIVIKTIHIRVWSTKVYVHVYSIAGLFVCLLFVTRDLPGTLTSRES